MTSSDITIIASVSSLGIAIGGFLVNLRMMKAKNNEQAMTEIEHTLQAHIAANKDRIATLQERLEESEATCRAKIAAIELDSKRCHEERKRLQTQIIELLAVQKRKEA